MKKVAFHTLGCKVNQYETNAITQKFIENGYEVASFDEFADIYIVNTCTVTNIADKKSRQLLRKVKQLNKESIVAAVGCYAQVAKQELEQMEEIDLVLGNNEKKDIIEYIEKFEEKQIAEISDVLYKNEYVDFGCVTYTENTRAVIKIQDGCDRFCSYCIIPYARGKIKSRKHEHVLNEIKEIGNKGIKEIVLTGIHIASYGRDLGRDNYLIELLEKIQQIDNIKRIRISSIEPIIITQDFVDRLVKLDKICDHFHLSLQSGCDETLKRMNRRYTTKEFEQAVNILRMAFPEVNLTTDIIVGFPGETDEEFEQTYKFLQKIKFFQMHVFKYSQRKGTKAAEMKNQVDGNIKEIRSKKLLELSDKNEMDVLQKQIGKKLEVLFEKETGHTKNYFEVIVNGIGVHNSIANVDVVGIKDKKLNGNLL